jgi:hypothetical protein
MEAQPHIVDVTTQKGKYIFECMINLVEADNPKRGISNLYN